MSTKMLIPLDGSELAETALTYAERIGKALGWGAVLFSVVNRDKERHLYDQSTPVVEAPRDVWDRYEEERAEGAEDLQHEETAAMDMMAAAASRLQAAGLHVEREVGVGPARDVIVRRAAADDIALIVMASHGRTGLARIFRGSVAAGVADHAQRATLVVRPFRDPEHRLDLEHADKLPPDQADAVRKAISA